MQACWRRRITRNDVRGIPPADGFGQGLRSHYVIDAYTPLAYSEPVIFIETPIFTRHVVEALSDDQYAKGEQTDLTPAQVKHLARYVEALK